MSGGWWTVSKFGQVTGNVCIELADRRYMFAKDNGRFVLGPQREGNVQTVVEKLGNLDM